MNHIEDYTLNSALPNLDCYVSPDEAAEAAKEIREVSKGLDLLASYAKVKARAMQFRLDGKINQALVQEQICDRIYKQLPDWAKW